MKLLMTLSFLFVTIGCFAGEGEVPDDPSQKECIINPTAEKKTAKGQVGSDSTGATNTGDDSAQK